MNMYYRKVYTVSKINIIHWKKTVAYNCFDTLQLFSFISLIFNVKGMFYITLLLYAQDIFLLLQNSFDCSELV